MNQNQKQKQKRSEKNLMNQVNRFSKSKIKEIKINFYEIENKNNRFTPEIKQIEKNLLELENNLFKPKKYYGYDDIKYKRIRDVRNLFDLSIDENYQDPQKTVRVFNNNYIEYESKGDKDKTLLIKQYLYMIKPY